MADDSDVIAATLLAGSAAIPVFTSLLPHISDVRKANDNETRRDVRLGEGAASALIVAFGFIAAHMTKSLAPIIVSVLAAGTLCAMYESVLKM